jgi:hypothetical protein
MMSMQHDTDFAALFISYVAMNSPVVNIMLEQSKCIAIAIRSLREVGWISHDTESAVLSFPALAPQV